MITLHCFVITLSSCVVEESYFKAQAKLFRFASNCSSRGYVFITYVWLMITNVARNVIP